jgi:hypothetical protein
MGSLRIDLLTSDQRNACETQVNVAGQLADPTYRFVDACMSLVPGAEKLHVDVIFLNRKEGAVNVLGRTNFATNVIAFARTVDDAVIELNRTDRAYV